MFGLAIRLSLRTREAAESMPNDLRMTGVPATGTREIVVLQNIHKRFGSTHAVNDVSTRFVAGEVHALLGENGAGKSTLGKIVGGLFPPDKGRLLLDGAEVQYRNIAEARSRGRRYGVPGVVARSGPDSAREHLPWEWKSPGIR